MTDPGNTYWWSPDRDAMSEWLRTRIRKKMADRNVRHFQIVNQKEREVVAFARWDVPEGYEAQFGEWVGSDDATENGAEEAEPATAKTMAGPRGSNPELCQKFFALLSGLSKKWNAERMLGALPPPCPVLFPSPLFFHILYLFTIAHNMATVGLSLLCTAPKYHRRGAAKALLTPMLALADAAGLRSYLEATPGGRPVYEKLGFRAVEVKEFDLDVLTGGKMKGCYKLSIMIREPQAL